MFSGGEVKPPASGDCWQSGNACKDHNDYPACVDKQRGKLIGNLQGYMDISDLPLTDKQASGAMKKGWSIPGALGICRSAQPITKKIKPKGSEEEITYQAYQYFTYMTYVGSHGGLALYNMLTSQEIHPFGKDGISLTAGEMKMLVQQLKLTEKDFKCVSKETCPGLKPGKEGYKVKGYQATGEYVFIVNYFRLKALIARLKALSAENVKRIGGEAKRTAVSAHLEQTLKETPQYMTEKGQQWQSDLSAAGVKAQAKLSERQLNAALYEKTGVPLTEVEAATLMEKLELRPWDMIPADKIFPDHAEYMDASGKSFQKIHLFLLNYHRLELIIEKLDDMEVNGITADRKAEIIAHLKQVKSQTPLGMNTKSIDSMGENTGKGILFSGIIGGLGIVASVGAMIWFVHRMEKKQDVALKKQDIALQLQERAIKMQETFMKAQADENKKPTIDKLAKDLVEGVRQDMGENLTSPIAKYLEIFRKLEEKRAVTRREQLDKPDAKLPDYKPSPQEVEAEKFVETMAGHKRNHQLVQDALSLIQSLEGSPNKESFVNATFGVKREVAEMAAFLIASDDPQIPESMKKANVWWETNPDYDITGRREEALHVGRLLARGQYQNVFLTAETGAGKFEVVRKLAHLMATNDPDLPASLRGKRLWYVDNTAMIAGTKYRGTFADKQQVLEAEMFEKGNVIFVEELATQARSGSTSGGDSESYQTWLLRTLTKENSRFVGDGKPTDYDFVVEKVGRDFRRRFERYQIDHMHPSAIQDALETQFKPKYQKDHNCTIAPGTVEAAVRLGIYYRDVDHAPPFDAGKSTLMNAVLEAKAEAASTEDHVTVTPDHVAKAIQKRLGAGVTVEHTAGDGMFAPETRPHTEHPHFGNLYNGEGTSDPASTPKMVTPHELKVDMLTDAMLKEPFFKALFGLDGMDEPSEGMKRRIHPLSDQAKIQWTLLKRAQRRAFTVVDTPQGKVQAPLIGEQVPGTFMDAVITEHDALIESEETTLLPFDVLRRKMTEKLPWFKGLSSQKQDLIMLSMSEAAQYEHVKASGAITPSGMMTPEAVNKILEIRGFKETVTDPVQVLTIGGKARRKQRKEAEGKETTYEKLLKEALKRAKEAKKL